MSSRVMSPPIKETPSQPIGSQLSFAAEEWESSQTSQLVSTQMESLTQMDECTQHSQMDGTPTPLSPPPPMPWGRLVPSLPSLVNYPIDLHQGQTEYWLGRSSTDIQIKPRRSLDHDTKENSVLLWAHSTISNLHCKISQVGPVRSSKQASSTSSSPSSNQNRNHNHNHNHANTNFNTSASPAAPQHIILEDNSGNGTCVNSTTVLRKGDQRILHSGDEICLVNPNTLRKKAPSGRIMRSVLQHYTYVLVLNNNHNRHTNNVGQPFPSSIQKEPRRPCVNPRAMNYHSNPGNQQESSETSALTSPQSARRLEAHYELREMLGNGTSGQVRRGIHRQTGKEYAIKIISLRHNVAQLEQEVNMMQSLDHPYIVQLVDVFVHRGIAMYLVMDLVKGGDLFDQIIQRERYTEVDARKVTRRLFSAVHYLHETKQMVHRDLKPENILCHSATHVKLADFGLAKILQKDGLKTFCGTPQYFAPEVLQRRTTVAGSGRYGKPADMWSLGVILYILLVGQPPFPDTMIPLEHRLEFDAAIWKDMPKAQDLVTQLLHLDPSRRLSIRQACDHPWILIKDGDTHIHPLDDPVVTGRKRLFDDLNGSLDPNESAKEEATSDMQIESAKDDSMTTKESEQLSSNVTHEKGNAINSDKGTNKDKKIQGEFTELEKKLATTALSSTEIISKNREMSVTSGNEIANNDDDEKSDTGISVPRSPLAAMNLNERGNCFRAHVLGQSGDAMSNKTEESPSRTSLISGQVAVTPTASNIHFNPNATSDDDYDDEDEEDPILSQFSSDPSSLESFPESPVKDVPSLITEKTDLELKTLKRKNPGSNEGQHSEATSTGNQKQKVQTKLSAWFVTKKAKIN